MAVLKRRDFRFSITKLIKDSGVRQEIEADGEIDEIFVSSAWVDPPNQVHVWGTLEAVHTGVMFMGSASVEITSECRRCLRVTSRQLNVDIRELFEKDFREDEADTYPIHGEFVDLSDMLRDAIVLALPSAPLCKESCSGLCQYCGANRNEVECKHDFVEIDPRFRVLDQLKE